MKTDIKQVAYMDTNKLGDWWVWNAFCDKCDKQFRNHKIYSSAKPDENQKDYCLSCMREMIDNKFNKKGEENTYEKY